MPAIYTRANLAWASVIKGCRTKAKLKQDQLADRCGMNQQDISKIEKGRRPLRAAEIPLFAKAFRMPTMKLFKRWLAFYEA